jgi:hypothetical protein
MKPGYKTTEFWLTIVVALAAFLNALPVSDPKIRAYIGAAVVALYTISRGLAKAGTKPLPLEPIESKAALLADPHLDEPQKRLKPRPISEEPEVSR